MKKGGRQDLYSKEEANGKDTVKGTKQEKKGGKKDKKILKKSEKVDYRGDPTQNSVAWIFVIHWIHSQTLVKKTVLYTYIQGMPKDSKSNVI